MIRLCRNGVFGESNESSNGQLTEVVQKTLVRIRELVQTNPLQIKEDTIEVR